MRKVSVSVARCACAARLGEVEGSCPDCGGEIGRACPVCAARLPGAFRYCGRCGTPLHPRAGSDGGGSAVEVVAPFCDLVGSTALSGRLDPEDLRRVVLAYQAACVEAIERRAGKVAQYLGDGILAFFGRDGGREADARAAFEAGLAIVAAAARLREQPPVPGVELAVRVGIHAGPAVSVGGGSEGRLALGATPALAARIQGLARPGEVAVTAAVRRIAGESFDYEPLGDGGTAEALPVPAFRLVS